MELKCQNCGGQLQFNESQVKAGHGWVVWQSHDALTCKFCGTEFVRGDNLSEDKGSLGDTTVTNGDNNTVIRNTVFDQRGQKVRSSVNISGNVYVRGDVTGGDSYTFNGRKIK